MINSAPARRYFSVSSNSGPTFSGCSVLVSDWFCDSNHGHLSIRAVNDSGPESAPLSIFDSFRSLSFSDTGSDSFHLVSPRYRWYRHHHWYRLHPWYRFQLCCENVTCLLRAHHNQLTETKQNNRTEQKTDRTFLFRFLLFKLSEKKVLSALIYAKKDARKINVMMRHTMG